MNYIIFGPPGIGKSTLIGQLKLNGLRAIDLEDIYPNQIRFSLPTQLDGVVFGGADLDPKKDYGPNVKKILLTMPSQAQYEKRRRERDAKQPGKGKQSPHQLEDWNTPNTFDKVIVSRQADNIRQTAGLVKQYINGVKHGTSKIGVIRSDG